MSLSREGYEGLRCSVEKIVNKYVTKDQTSLVSLISHAIDSGIDQQKLEGKLSNLVEKKLAKKLAYKTYTAFENIMKKSSKKRSNKEDLEKVSKKSKLNDDETKNSESAAEVFQAQQIKDLMAKAQASIEERKRALAIQSMAKLQNNSTNQALLNGKQNTVPMQKNAAIDPAPLDVTSRIARLQARIQNQLGNVAATMSQAPKPPILLPIPPTTAPLAALQAKASTEEPLTKPTPLILDEEGRAVDDTGREIHLTSRLPTLKANIRAKIREEFKHQLQEKPTEEPVESEYFDPRVNTKSSLRQKRAFKFHEHGKYIQLGQRERAKSRLEKLQQQISQVARRTGISSAAKLAQLEQRTAAPSHGTPDVEWWDAIILENDRYPEEGSAVRIKNERITNLVEHPMEMKSGSDNSKQIELHTIVIEDNPIYVVYCAHFGENQKSLPILVPKVFLTRKERKKLRRMNRRETWKEKQEKIRLGLEPPPEAKVRMANLMRVLGTEAVIDPTKMEKHVREQMAKRLKAHEDANAARKLTREQRRDKNINKMKEDTTETGLHVAIYRVTDLSNGAHKFKVETNAKQFYLTGVVALYKDVNVVVVEGGPRQMKKYKRLMLERIKWVEESRSKDASIESKCQLVWEGQTQERSFGDVQFKSFPSENFAREFFKKHLVEHYWDLAYGKKVLEEAEEAS